MAKIKMYDMPTVAKHTIHSVLHPATSSQSLNFEFVVQHRDCSSIMTPWIAAITSKSVAC